jgi:hypothetical protein
VSADRPVPFDLSGRAAVGLDEVVDHAAQLTRVDRKYLVRREVAEAFVAGLPAAFRVLTIGGRRSTSYASVYFDTPLLDACRDHVQRRRRRWKIRSRLYVEDRLCRIEVKTKDRRGLTTKAVATSHPSRHGLLDGPEAQFVAGILSERAVDVDVSALGPSMEVRYERLTLADTDQSLRVTLDWDVDCRLHGGRVWVDDDWALVETKGGLRPSEADRVLTALGARPRPFSKYVSAASLLSPHIADNDVRSLHGRQLHAIIDDAQELSA